jgi:hypothetical protein
MIGNDVQMSDLSDVYLSTLALNVPSTWIKSEKDAGDGIAVSRVASVRRKSNFEIGGEYQWQKIVYVG